MKWLWIALLLAPAAWPQKVEVEFDQDLNYAKFHTFAIRNGRLNSRNPSLNSELIRKRIDSDIHRFLEARGLVYVSEGKPDLNVVYTLGAVRKAEIETYPAGWRGWGTRVVRVPYTEGTLVIDFRDTGTRSLAWRAIVREEKSDASKIEAKLDDMVKKAIEKYPPKIKD